MLETSDQSRRSGQSTATLGRLGGLGPGEADRGEKALWLSGGGYRAALFHLGALTRLNESGLLARIGTVGAVSGGSVLAALLAARVPWPLQGAFRDWPEQVAEPLREIARRNARARLRRSLTPQGASAALEERYARQLLDSLGEEPRQGPRFVFGAAGLTLAGLVDAQPDRVEWGLGDTAQPPGYGPELVAGAIESLPAGLDALGEAEQAVLENHGYLLADAALRERGLATSGGIETGPPEPPHPRWMDGERVRGALVANPRRAVRGRRRARRTASGGGGREGKLSAEELAALLERHRPLLQYDSLESFRADSAATICGALAPGRCNTLHRADGSLIAAASPDGEETRLELDFLRGPTYPDGRPARDDDYIDECGGSHPADSLEARRREGCADVVYGRACRDGEGRLWLQYFFFYYYDDKGLLGLVRHEGDWEMVQLGLGEDLAPREATFARHAGAERLGWEQVERADGAGEVPVVYPARGSHASLPRAGSYEAPVVPDHNDGIGARVRPRLATVGDDGPGWLLWPGRWGSTRRRESFEGDSPRGPRELPQWRDPAELHREARPWNGGGTAGGEGLAPPPRPHVEARREGDLAVVSYRFPERRHEESEPARIVAAPLAVSDFEPCGADWLPVEGREGSFAIQLPSERDWGGVRVSASSERGVPGETIAVVLREQERAG